MKAELNMDSVIAQNKNLVVSEINGETVMMSLEKGNYYGMNLIGSRIWEIVKEPKPVNEIVDELLKEYSVEKEQCVEDVTSYINKLLDENIIEIVNESN
ncbi:MAG: lasso peptide biosynthesis PqqD family chaperone [Ignavibacteria bacterium]|jgi:hypothetical protein